VTPMHDVSYDSPAMLAKVRDDRRREGHEAAVPSGTSRLFSCSERAARETFRVDRLCRRDWGVVEKSPDAMTPCRRDLGATR
jgi:hypothetical protein